MKKNLVAADAFPPDNTRPPLAVSKKQAARELSLCVRTIDILIAQKKLSALRVGKRVLVRYASLQNFVRRGDVTTTNTAGPEQVQ